MALSVDLSAHNDSVVALRPSSYSLEHPGPGPAARLSRRGDCCLCLLVSAQTFNPGGSLTHSTQPPSSRRISSTVISVHQRMPPLLHN